ncbi:MAG: radical SAM protein [Phycisphaerae bacterium]|nr:radical SAM protein [Phycisphaerae bacterium]
MSLPNLQTVAVANPQVAQRLAAQSFDEAREHALGELAVRLSDLAIVEMAAGDIDAAIQRLEQAVNASPARAEPLHNLLAALLTSRRLRGPALESLTRFVAAHHATQPWLQRYDLLLFLPRFVNFEFVAGKCNLHCRMCVGRNAPNYPDRLTYVSTDVFEETLAAAPTVNGLTLSSGDSDPLLHPQFEQILDIAKRHAVCLDLYTNGHPLGARIARRIVDSQVVQMLNFSIDAATPETYQRIRGDDFGRLRQKITMLATMKREAAAPWPWISFSFAAMKDNIEELPDFISLACELGASRVFVGDLIGWDGGPSDNALATDHPRCFEFVAEARRRASVAGVQLQLPQRLLHPPAPEHTRTDRTAISMRGRDASFDPAAGRPSTADSATIDAVDPAARRWRCCTWITGVWVQTDGRIDPCCLVHDVADMGNVHDGPLHANQKFARVKRLLMSGKVFEACRGQRMCEYVQQQQTAGIPLRIIREAELGALYRPIWPAGTKETVPLSVSARTTAAPSDVRAAARTAASETIAGSGTR